MNSPAILLLVAALIFDIALLKKKHLSLYKEIFFFSPPVLLGCSAVILIVVLLSGKVGYVPLLFMLFIFPFYLEKRSRFIKILEDSSLLSRSDSFTSSLAIDASGNILYWFAWMILFSAIVYSNKAIWGGIGSDLGESVLMTMFSSVLMIVLICRTISKYSGVNLSDVLGLKFRGKSLAAVFLFPIVIALVFALISSAVVLMRDSQPPTPLSELVGSNTSVGIFIAFFAAAVLLSPFFEEIIFRGYFYYVIEKYKGQRAAILIITFTFAALHLYQYWGDWAAICMVSVLGFVLTTMRAKTGSSISSIVAHYVYNGAMTIIPVLIIFLSNPSYSKYIFFYSELTSSQKEELLLASVDNHPEHADSYNDLAWLYAQEDRSLDEALFFVEKALVLDPTNIAFLDTKAEVYFKMGRIQEAIDIQEKILEKDEAGPYYKEQCKKFKEALL